MRLILTGGRFDPDKLAGDIGSPLVIDGVKAAHVLPLNTILQFEGPLGASKAHRASGWPYVDINMHTLEMRFHGKLVMTLPSTFGLPHVVYYDVYQLREEE